MTSATSRSSGPVRDAPVLGVDLDELGAAVGRLRTTADALDDERRRLHRSFDDLLGTGWRGAASSSYVEGWTQWSTGVGEVLDALRSMADLVEAQGWRTLAGDVDAGLGLSAVTDRLARWGAA